METNKLVLVIDDEEPVREAVADILELEGIPTLAAANGQEGIQLYQQNIDLVNVVLLDLSMPGISGEETLDQLYALDPNVQVVLSSGYSELDARKQVNEAAVAGFIQKPYDLLTFVGEIRRHFDK